MADINLHLIRRCKENDREAFSLLLARHEGYLYRLCYSYLHNKEDALDVVQEIFIKVIRNINSFDENRDFAPWLKKIAINTSLNYLRDSQKKNHLSLDYENEGNATFLETLAADDNLEEKIVQKSTRDSIQKCMEHLPPHYRIVLTLRYLEDLSYQEIATLLEQPLGTVKNSLFRARSLLKETMQKTGLLEV